RPLHHRLATTGRVGWLLADARSAFARAAHSSVRWKLTEQWHHLYDDGDVQPHRAVAALPCHLLAVRLSASMSSGGPKKDPRKTLSPGVRQRSTDSDRAPTGSRCSAPITYSGVEFDWDGTRV